MGQGHDFSGVVVALGPGVTGFDVGDAVIGFAPRAAMADFTLVDADAAARKPAGIDFASAATIPASGATAWAAVAAVAPTTGETVFVSAAAGGAGVFAAQLARLRGARVIGGASPANARRLAALGIEPVAHGARLHYRLRELVPDGIDAVIDTFGGGYVDLAIELGVPPHRVNRRPRPHRRREPARVRQARHPTPTRPELTRHRGGFGVALHLDAEVWPHDHM